MPEIEAHGIRVRAPVGVDARIRRTRPRRPAPTPADAGDSAAADESGEVYLPVVHLATRPLPNERGDYGSGVVEQLGDSDILVCLVELDPAATGSELIAGRGFPRSLPVEAFAPHTMQRTIAGQSGTQLFFTEAGRAFCLYAVLGSHAQRDKLVPHVNQLLAAITIDS